MATHEPTGSSQSAEDAVKEEAPTPYIPEIRDGLMDSSLSFLANLPSKELEDFKEAVAYDLSDVDAVVPRSEPTLKSTITVVEQDCLAAAIELSHGTSDVPLVLNMANEFNCGGGFDYMKGSQEEYLFRSTSLAASLWAHRRPEDNRWPKGSQLLGRSSPFYPLSPISVVYSPRVFIHSVEGKEVSDRCTISVISVAAQDLRPGRDYNAGARFDFDLLVAKLRTLLLVARRHGHRTLVLGALGCGAFENPPLEVARAYHHLLTPPAAAAAASDAAASAEMSAAAAATAAAAGEFAGAFERVVFPVIFSARNLQAFQRFFTPPAPAAA